MCENSTHRKSLYQLFLKKLYSDEQIQVKLSVEAEITARMKELLNQKTDRGKLMEPHTITEYHARINELIESVENGSREQSVLDEIETDFYQLAELIRLFLISERDSYYGYYMMNLVFHADFHENIFAGIRLNPYPPVMDSNPLLLCRYPLKEMIFILCHEVEHVILCHPTEMVKANPRSRRKTGRL